MHRANQGPSIGLITLVSTLILLASVLGCSQPGPTDPTPGPFTHKSPQLAPTPVAPHQAADQVCVLLDDGDGLPLDLAAIANEIAADYGLTLVQTFGGGALVLYEGTTNLVALTDDSRVRAAQGNESTILGRPVEVVMGFFEGDWDEIGLPQQESLASLGLSYLHRRILGRGMRVAVLDTGVDPNHGLLAGRLEMIPPGSSVLSSEEVEMGLDTDGDGLVDEAFGHGTHVAGIVATIAPAATILPIRVLDSDGIGDAFTVAMGLYTAQEMGAHVINLSLVLSEETSVIEAVLRDVTASGIVVVGAGGNVPGEAQFPATDSHVVGVGATDALGGIAPFSAVFDIRFMAPGVAVESAFPGDRVAWASGTSMACAAMTGCIALLGESVPDLNRLVEILHDTAGRIDGTDGRLVNPAAALRTVRIISAERPTRVRR